MCHATYFVIFDAPSVMTQGLASAIFFIIEELGCFQGQIGDRGNKQVSMSGATIQQKFMKSRLANTVLSHSGMQKQQYRLVTQWNAMMSMKLPCSPVPVCTPGDEILNPHQRRDRAVKSFAMNKGLFYCSTIFQPRSVYAIIPGWGKKPALS